MIGGADVNSAAGIASFARAKRLVLRGLLRTPQDSMHGTGTTVKTVASLDRGKDGVFRGGFVLPDSVVYVAMVVKTPWGGA